MPDIPPERDELSAVKRTLATPELLALIIKFADRADVPCLAAVNKSFFYETIKRRWGRIHSTDRPWISPYDKRLLSRECHAEYQSAVRHVDVSHDESDNNSYRYKDEMLEWTISRWRNDYRSVVSLDKLFPLISREPAWKIRIDDNQDPSRQSGSIWIRHDVDFEFSDGSSPTVAQKDIIKVDGFRIQEERGIKIHGLKDQKEYGWKRVDMAENRERVLIWLQDPDAEHPNCPRLMIRDMSLLDVAEIVECKPQFVDLDFELARDYTVSDFRQFAERVGSKLERLSLRKAFKEDIHFNADIYATDLASLIDIIRDRMPRLEAFTIALGSSVDISDTEISEKSLDRPVEWRGGKLRYVRLVFVFDEEQTDVLQTDVLDCRENRLYLPLLSIAFNLARLGSPNGCRYEICRHLTGWRVKEHEGDTRIMNSLVPWLQQLSPARYAKVRSLGSGELRELDILRKDYRLISRLTFREDDSIIPPSTIIARQNIQKSYQTVLNAQRECRRIRKRFEVIRDGHSHFAAAARHDFELQNKIIREARRSTEEDRILLCRRKESIWTEAELRGLQAENIQWEKDFLTSSVDRWVMPTERSLQSSGITFYGVVDEAALRSCGDWA